MANILFVDNKESNSWIDLDDDLYNNHFNNGQCQLRINFNRLMSITDENGTEISSTIERNLPIYPEDINFGTSTNYASTDIIGRPGTIAGYVNTSDVTSKITLHLHRELEIPGYVETDKNKIDELILLIQACAYPKQYGDGLYVPIVTYKFGDTCITGKQTSWDATWGGPKIGNAYMDVKLNISISHVPNGIEFFDDILKHENPRTFI